MTDAPNAATMTTGADTVWVEHEAFKIGRAHV